VGVLRGKGEAPFPQTPIPQGDISIEVRMGTFLKRFDNCTDKRLTLVRATVKIDLAIRQRRRPRAMEGTSRSKALVFAGP
jgi:hypothetical protein